MADYSLDRVPLFFGLPKSELELIAARTYRKSFPARTQIMWRGEPGANLYIIVDGCVKVHSSSENGSEVTLAVLRKGECFGELSIIDGAPRSTDVTSLVPTRCLVLDSQALKDAVERNPSIAWHLMARLATLLRKTNDAVESLACRDVSGRLANLLLSLGEHHGEPWTRPDTATPPVDGICINLKLSKNDLKAFVGATREHVSNVMSDFTRRGYITSDPVSNKIVLLDTAGLTSIAQS
jgi:CRP/FNR family transcriptional regulator/CRP/FNR family cyclic AMP-dependent transcriptional regulator